MIHYNIYNSFKELPEGWNALVKHDVFLQTPYLQALEEASPNNLQLFYIAVFKADVLVGVALTQRVQLYLQDMFRKTQVSCFKTYVRDVVSKILKGNILVIGNVSHTGQHGLFFKRQSLSQEVFFNV